MNSIYFLKNIFLSFLGCSLCSNLARTLNLAVCIMNIVGSYKKLRGIFLIVSLKIK